jgi:hypothetical protein
MPLYAVVRDNQYDPSKLAEGQAALDEFQALHDRQVGSLGTLIIDGLVPEVERLIEPVLAAPSQLIVAGPVRVDTLLNRERVEQPPSEGNPA